MTLLNLSQAKQAAGTAKEVKYVYSGPGAWPIPVETPGDGRTVVSAPNLKKTAGMAKAPEAPKAKKAEEPPYTVPMFVPMDKDSGKGAADKYAGWVRPLHISNIDTRGHILGVWLGYGNRGNQKIADSDSYTGIYSSYFWAGFSFVAMILTYLVHPYISAVFAYLWGHFWSEYMIGNAWGVAWFKGKSLVHAT